MVRKEINKDSKIIEHGDLFFFYRPKIDATHKHIAQHICTVFD